MRIVVIGLGSMGRRRIRLALQEPGVEIVGVDVEISRRVQAQQELGIKVYESLAEAVNAFAPEAAFICTSPLGHASLIKSCLEKGLHVFTEINLVADGYAENIALAQRKGLTLFLSSTFLYNDTISEIRKRVEEVNSQGLNYMYHIGQYLPDWHPWEAYQNYFVSNPRTNGCREIMAIELPWLVSAFGPVQSVMVVKSNRSDLNLPYPDTYQIMLHHTTGVIGMLGVDVVSCKATRRLEVYGQDVHLTWDGTPNSLLVYDKASRQAKSVMPNEDTEHLDGYAEFIAENPYRKEIRAFMAQIEFPHTKPQWDFERDAEVLKVIDQIEGKR